MAARIEALLKKIALEGEPPCSMPWFSETTLHSFFHFPIKTLVPLVSAQSSPFHMLFYTHSPKISPGSLRNLTNILYSQIQIFQTNWGSPSILPDTAQNIFCFLSSCRFSRSCSLHIIQSSLSFLRLNKLISRFCLLLANIPVISNDSSRMDFRIDEKSSYVNHPFRSKSIKLNEILAFSS